MIDNYTIYNREMLLPELLFIEDHRANRDKWEGTKLKLNKFSSKLISWTTVCSTKIYLAEIRKQRKWDHEAMDWAGNWYAVDLDG